MSLKGNEKWFLENESDLNEQFILDMYSTLANQSMNWESGWKKEELKSWNNIEAWSNMKGTVESYNSSDLKLNMKQNFIMQASNAPVCRVDWTSTIDADIDSIINSLYNWKYRMEWDDSVESVNVVEEDHPNLSIVHTKNSKIALFSPRQFIDKRVTFKYSSDIRNLGDVRLLHN